MKHFCYILLLTLIISQCRPKEENTVLQFPGKPEVPSPIKEEHEHLLEEIHKISLLPDSAGHVAIKLNDLIQHHFAGEEDYVLPPLGLLPSLANGKLPEQTKEILLLTEKCKSQLQHLSVEHQLIKAYTDELVNAASGDSKKEINEFVNALHKHAVTEEQVFFPTSILIGEYLKLKSTPQNN
jgi:hypothetical protein